MLSAKPLGSYIGTKEKRQIIDAIVKFNIKHYISTNQTEK
ncbi:hypothetical protein FACS1894105_10200 [Clostridia bacterium]|nr:hypothetical protein FACS1894105_10200 [Clostridia bacterium]